jgi:N-dimethylarginine dimethylaminohydrolase
MSRLPNARKAEEAYAETILRSMGKEIFHVPGEFRFSGQGDALPCGNYLFAGSGYRSDPEAQQFVAETLGYKLIQLQAVPQLDANNQPVTNASSGWPDSFYYDIDLALSILKPPTDTEKGLIAWCPAAFTPESQEILRNFDKVDKIEVSEQEAKEAFACNLVSTGETVIMNAGATEFAAALEARGLQTIRLSNPELGKGGGSIRCTTLTLDNL